MKKNMLFGLFLAAVVLMAGGALNAGVQWLYRERLDAADATPAPMSLLATTAVLLFVAGVLAQFLLIRWSYDRLPGRGYVAKGIVFGVLYLVAGRQFMATPFVTGGSVAPLWLFVLDFLTGALFVLAASVILAYYVEEAKRPDPALPR